MNAQVLTISENVQGCIKSISPSEAKKFFDSMRQVEYAKIKTPEFAEEKELTNMRSRVILIDEIEHLFSELRNTK